MAIMKPVLRIIPGLQSLAVMSRAVGLIPKKPFKPLKKDKPKKMVKGFFDITVGTALIKPTSAMINRL